MHVTLLSVTSKGRVAPSVLDSGLHSLRCWVFRSALKISDVLLDMIGSCLVLGVDPTLKKPPSAETYRASYRHSPRHRAAFRLEAIRAVAFILLLVGDKRHLVRRAVRPFGPRL